MSGKYYKNSSNKSYDYEKSIAEERAKNLYRSFEHSSLELEQLLVEAISQGSLEKALEVLEQINANERAELSTDSLRSLQLSLIGSCTIFTRAAISGGVVSESAFILSDLFIRELDRTKTIEEATEIEYKMLIVFVNAVNQSQKGKENVQYSHIVTRARNIIQRNFMRRFSLAEIAEQVNLHPNYLSQQFKKETDQTIMEYYDELRTEAIGQYLAYTDMSMLDIANLFDFSSSAHFSYHFKKHTGKSPSTYRKDRHNQTLI